ncbi:MAG: NAD-dependent epimerase/dehydratase family protein [Phycisphaerales bacterium]|nr:MAG: NAD-dependent epimerase/dehydratase family protein [Phycisphaerales bacterium]
MDNQPHRTTPTPEQLAQHAGARRTFLKRSIGYGALLAAGLQGGGLLARAERAAFGAEARGLKILILGGTGFLGPHIVEAALARGHTLTLFHRGRTNPDIFPGVEKLIGNRDGDLAALEGDREWDVVIDTSAYYPRVVRDSAGLLRDRVRQYVFISSVSVYADNRNPGADETAPVGTIDDPDIETVTGSTFGPLKALCEQAAERAMPGRVTNIRPGLIVGPRDGTDRFTYWPVRVARGGEVLAPNSPDDPIQFIDVRDLGDWIVNVAERNTTGVFNALGPNGGTTIGKLLQSCKDVSGSDARFVWADAAFLTEQGVAPWSQMTVWIPPVGGSAGFSRRSNARAVAAGLTFRTVDDTVRATLAWFNEQPAERRENLRAGLDADLEAQVLEAWRERNT